VSATFVWGGAAVATEDKLISSHGYSYFGNLDYPADYPHLNHVNPDAPRGAELSLSSPGTVDALNPYSRPGRSGALTSLQYARLW